jgi:hypothetical protein
MPRRLLGQIRLMPRRPDIGKPDCMAQMSIDAVAFSEPPSEPRGPEGGSNSLQ